MLILISQDRYLHSEQTFYIRTLYSTKLRWNFRINFYNKSNILMKNPEFYMRYVKQHCNEENIDQNFILRLNKIQYIVSTITEINESNRDKILEIKKLSDITNDYLKIKG